MHVLGAAAFLVSGVAALLYQVIWQRMIVPFSGADVYSASLVVAAFMMGLGCGSLAGGLVADRVSRAASVALFAGAELGIALFGAQSATILYDGLYVRLGHLAAQPAVTAGVVFLTLLWPTFLMGASLPLLSRALTSSVDTAARTIGWLYACNTLGAAIGAFCGVWLVLPRHGLDGGLALASYLNVACAAGAVPLLAWVALRRRVDSPGTAAARTPSSAGSPLHGASMVFSRRVWVALYALSGFLALSFEIVWFRLLGVMLKSTAFTFGTLLAHYLFWLGAGSALGSIVARRLRRPAVAFLSVQMAAGAYGGLGLVLILTRIDASPSWAWFRDYLGSYEPMRVASASERLRWFVNDVLWHTPNASELPYDFLWMYFVLPALLIGPATLLMGVGFPLMQRVVQTDLTRLGRRVGTLLVANIVGSTLGSLVTGWLFLGWLGTAGTLRLLVILSSGFGLCAVAAALASGRRRYAGYAAVAALTAAVVTAVPRSDSLWASLHGTSPDKVLFAEDATGLALLKARGDSFRDRVQVFLNGLGQSQLPYGDGTQTLLGAIPAMIHPSPRSAAVVGLGSGNTVAALAGRREIEHITSIEIIAPLVGLLRQAADVIGYSGLSALLQDPRVDHVFGDGRLVIGQSGRRFDIIEADALRPESAYSGSLYSVEYFELLRAHIAPGGLAVSWAPTDRVELSFFKVFPHVAQYGGVLLGSNEPIVVDREAITRRLDDPEVQRYYSRLGMDIRDLLIPRLWSPVVPEIDRASISEVNTDLFPRDEFGIPVMFDLSMLRPEGSR